MSISRRKFITGAALGSGLALAGLTGCAASAAKGEGDALAASGTAASPLTPDALRKAGYWDIVSEPIEDFAEEIDADVVVLGAGVGGLNAAAAAAEEGAKVVVLEKSETVSGRGGDNGVIGSRPQDAEGIEIDKVDVIRYQMQWAKHKNNMNLFKVWVHRSGEVANEIIAICEEAGYKSGRVQSLPPHKDVLEPFYRMYPTNISFAMEPQEFDDAGNWIFPQVIYAGILKDHAESLGTEFRFKTPAVQLVTDDAGKVVGAIGQNEDGGYIKINASRGVVMAVGDIAGSDEMVEAFSPLPLHNASGSVKNMYTPAGCNTGDHLRMGFQVGAAPQLAPPAPMVHVPAAQTPFGPPYCGWLQVNALGERFHEEEPNEVSNANGLMTQPGCMAWWFFDGDYQAKVLAMQPDNSGYFGAPFIDDTTQATIDQQVADGILVRADTLDELAEKCGLPADTFKKTVARYNKLCATGIDEDFGKRELWMKSTSLETPPFYAAPIEAFFFVIMYGLHCDKYSRVLNGSDEPIEGLFAVGNSQGDFFADEYPLICPGISHGRAAVFGRLVGKALAHGELYDLGYEE